MENIATLKLIAKLDSGDGRFQLNNLLNVIKKNGIKQDNCDIYTMININSPDVQIVCLDWTDNNISKYISDFESILKNNILQPQLISDMSCYVPIYDDDYKFSGKIIKKSYLVHFFMSNDTTNEKIQILVQKGNNCNLADRYIRINGRKFYDL